MNEQLAYTLMAASVGFVAAIFFGYGAALLRQKAIVLLASTYWDYNKEQATAIVSQSAQYLVGGLLLVISFVFQVMAALAPSEVSASFPGAFLNPSGFVLLTLVVAGLAGWLCYRLLLKWRLPRVLKALENSL